DIARWVWRGDILFVDVPAVLAPSVLILGRAFPLFRLFVIAVGLVLAALIWLLLERTRLGAIVRAGVSDPEMLDGLGINVRLVFTLVFALGAALAGFGGVVGGPILGVFPGVDLDILITTLIVVVIGGLGTVRGAFWGSLLVGEVQTFGLAFWPQVALFLLFGMMAVVLLVRPTGLMGEEAT
ncbi:MAG TPA: branched-chain amino acid ABC transporter permease, partial [Ardenticatenaceae bacterium]|nr:branched-chain amino acid ABC transporter permease [Ardenticatenaceae bacterium]